MRKKSNLKLEFLCLVISWIITFSFYASGRLISAQDTLDFVPLAFGAVGFIFSFWVWNKISQISEKDNSADRLRAGVPLIVALSAVVGMLIGLAACRVTINMGSHLAISIILAVAGIVLGMALGLRIRSILLKKSVNL